MWCSIDHGTRWEITLIVRAGERRQATNGSGKGGTSDLKSECTLAPLTGPAGGRSSC